MGNRRFAGLFLRPHNFPQVWKEGVPPLLRRGFLPPPQAVFGPPRFPHRLWRTLPEAVRLYWPSAASALEFSPLWIIREADLSAQRAPPEAQARLPRPHGHARRARDHQTPPRERPEAAVGVTAVQRRNRLSRSRDFDSVYRHGRSVSSRFLVLYSFAREDGPGESRLGIAIPKKVGGAVVRNRIKRQLRELWRARLNSVPAGADYVLVARPGLAEAAETQGYDWLGERVDEVLGKAAA